MKAFHFYKVQKYKSRKEHCFCFIIVQSRLTSSQCMNMNVLPWLWVCMLVYAIIQWWCMLTTVTSPPVVSASPVSECLVYLTYSNRLCPHKILRRIWENSQHSLAYLPVLIFVLRESVFTGCILLTLSALFSLSSLGNIHQSVWMLVKCWLQLVSLAVLSATVADIQSRSLADQIAKVAIECWKRHCRHQTVYEEANCLNQPLVTWCTDAVLFFRAL